MPNASPAPARRSRMIEEPAAESSTDGGAGDTSASETASDGAEVVDLTPAQLSEMVQDEQDTASA